jgi:hypothetical protein
MSVGEINSSKDVDMEKILNQFGNTKRPNTKPIALTGPPVSEVLKTGYTNRMQEVSKILQEEKELGVDTEFGQPGIVHRLDPSINTYSLPSATFRSSENRSATSPEGVFGVRPCQLPPRR